MPNVDARNNKLKYIPSDNVTHEMTFDIGLYSIEEVNFRISLFTGINNGSDDLIYFTADQPTSKIYINI